MREEKLNQYLNSEEFYEVLYRFKEAGEEKNNELKDIISFFTYLSIELYLIVDDIELVSDFNLAVLKMYIDNKDKYVSDYFRTDYAFENDYNNLYNYYIRKFYKEKKNISDDTSMLRDIYNNVGRFEWRFHAFNSNLSDSIKKYGINPNVKFTPQEEIDQINNIFEKYNVRNVFGWQKLNCEGKVYYSSTPSVSYRYGLDSPEWFSQFVGGATCYGKKEDNSNFRRKDYDASLECITKLMRDRGFEETEQKYVIDFFDKYWQIYAVNSQPMVAVIPKETHLVYERFESKYTALEYMSEVCFSTVGKDLGVTGVMDTSNAMYVSMPRYHDVLKYFGERKKADKVNIDIEYLGVDETTYASFLSFNISILSSLKEEEFVDFFTNSILKDFGENSSYFERTGRCISLKYNGNKLKSIIVPESLAKSLIKFIDKNVSSNITIGNYLYSEYKNEFDDIYDEFIIDNTARKNR